MNNSSAGKNFIFAAIITFWLISLTSSHDPEPNPNCAMNSTASIADCGYDNLRDIPYTFLEEKQFKTLILSYNRIRNIDNNKISLFTYKVLIENIQLDHNDISQLHDWFDDLPNLKTLNLAYNQIREIRHTIGRMPNLETLILDGNSITEISRYAFQRLPKLTTLSIQNCNLRSLPTDIFRYTKNLKHVYIFGNDINNLDLVYFPNPNSLDKVEYKAQKPQSQIMQGVGVGGTTQEDVVKTDEEIGATQKPPLEVKHNLGNGKSPVREDQRSQHKDAAATVVALQIFMITAVMLVVVVVFSYGWRVIRYKNDYDYQI